jgi:hypothetical protein
MKFDKNIDIERGDWLQIECCSDRAANRVAFNHTVNPHAVDRLDDGLYAHAAGNFA